MEKKPWKYVTILAVVRVPDFVAEGSDEKLLKDVTAQLVVSAALDNKPSVTDVRFVSVYRGVSLAALEAGCEPPEPEEDTPLCKLCHKGQAHHFEHHPRHTFQPEE